VVVEGFRGPRIIDLRHSGFPHDGYIHEDVDTMAYKKRLPDDSGSGCTDPGGNHHGGGASEVHDVEGMYYAIILDYGLRR